MQKKKPVALARGGTSWDGWHFGPYGKAREYRLIDPAGTTYTAGEIQELARLALELDYLGNQPQTPRDRPPQPRIREKLRREQRRRARRRCHRGGRPVLDRSRIRQHEHLAGVNHIRRHQGVSGRDLLPVLLIP